MKLIIEIELGNDAMQTGQHVARVLRDVARRVKAAYVSPIDRPDERRIRDENGNTIGTWRVIS